MPVMEGGTGQPLLHHTKTPINVGVHKISPQATNDQIGTHQCSSLPQRPLGKTTEIDERNATEFYEHHIKWMGAAGHQPVDGFGLVMDAMEVPEQRDFVAPAIPPSKNH